MKREGPQPGEIYLAEFPLHNPCGHEQQGIRPAMVIAIPERARFPVLWVIPITTDREQPWLKSSSHLYLRLSKGIGGLPANSVLLLDQLRSLDTKRVKRFVGTVNQTLLQKVMHHCLQILGPFKSH